ncbi:MAG: hypothetical protein Q9160_002429 [Pyrenula sp. 1 TL-2023]
MTTNEHIEPLAIIGFSMEFPDGVVSEDDFWDKMMRRECTAEPFPEDRLSRSGFYNPNLKRRDVTPVTVGSFLRDDIRAFDASFFSISPSEAAGMDPQQRRMLETTYHALENAGIGLEQVSGTKTSVHVGTFTNDYKDLYSIDPETGSHYAASGLEASIISNRVSWYFNLTGPSATVDTACSNGRCYSFDDRASGYARGEGFGVVVLKRLSDAIHHGDVIRAVIRSSGVNQDGRTTSLTQPSPQSQARLISDTYQKACLDIRKTGYVEAHGTGTPVGDPIEASAIGNAFKDRKDEKPLYIGAVKSNLGHLEGASGIAGVLKALLVLEHGTIPPNANFENLNPRIDRRALHIEFPRAETPWPSMGMRQASINSFGFGGTNAHVVLNDAYHYLQERGLEAQHCTLPSPRLAGTGINGIKVEQDLYNQEREQHIPRQRPYLVIWSAADKGGMKRLENAFANHFTHLKASKNVEISLEDLCYTLNERRTLHPWRSYSIIDTLENLQQPHLNLPPPVHAKQRLGCAWIFTGQGAQWPAMGRELIGYTSFRDSLSQTTSHLNNLGCQWVLEDELFRSEDCSRIHDVSFSQPICTAVQLALVDLLWAIGVRPKAVIGHSSGEIAAAYSIGAISHRSAMEIAYYRGVFAHDVQEKHARAGAMMSVGLSETQVRPYLSRLALSDQEQIEIACFNSPQNLTLSGIAEHITYLQDELRRDEVFARKLNVGVAYHSRQMREVSEEYAMSLQNIEHGDISPNSALMISTVTGQAIPTVELQQPSYWVENLVSPVKFTQALRTLCSLSSGNGQVNRSKDTLLINDLLEIGPHAALQGPIRDTLKELESQSSFQYNSILIRKTSASASFMNLAGKLYCSGYKIDLRLVNNFESFGVQKPRIITTLPKYPFDHSKTYWHESRLSTRLRHRSHGRVDLLGTPATDWNPACPRWRNFINLEEMPWLIDHKIDGSVIYPAAAMMVTALEALWQLATDADRIRPNSSFCLKNVVFHNALRIPSSPGRAETQLQLQKLRRKSTKHSMWFEFRLDSWLEDRWIEHCDGIIGLDNDNAQSDSRHSIESDEQQRYHEQCRQRSLESCTIATEKLRFYQTLEKCGFAYGPAFQTLDNIAWNGNDVSCASIRLRDNSNKDESAGFDANVIHPTILDGLLQLVLHTAMQGCMTVIPPMVVSRVADFRISMQGPNSISPMASLAIAQLRRRGYRGLDSSISILDTTSGRPCLDIDGYELTTLADPNAHQMSNGPKEQSCLQFEQAPDIGLLGRYQLEDLCHLNRTTNQEPAAFFSDIDRVIRGFISQAINTISRDVRAKSIEGHLGRYAEWLRMQYNRFGNDSLRVSGTALKNCDQGDDQFQQLCSRLEHSNAEGRLYVAIGRALPDILTGKVNPLALVFNDGLADDFYQHISDSRPCYRVLKECLNLLAHKNPRMRILELSAGTGGTSRLVLESLSKVASGESRHPRYAQYDFAAIAPSLLQEAQKNLSNHQHVNFMTLDIEKDPISKGFEEGMYDLVIAANVLHATGDIASAIRNTRKLLKSGGKLVLVEITGTKLLRTGFVFGTLSSWWKASEKSRYWSPALPSASWHDLLVANGFSGTDLVIPDYENDVCHEISVIVTEAVDDKYFEDITIPAYGRIVIVIDTTSNTQVELARKVKECIITNLAAEVDILSLKDVMSANNHQCRSKIFLLDIQSQFLPHIAAEDLSRLKDVARGAKSCIWVADSEATYANIGMAEGLWRTLQIENNDTSYVTLAMQDSKASGVVRAMAIQNLISSVESSSSGRHETAFALKNGLLQITRSKPVLHLAEKLGIDSASPTQVLNQDFGSGLPLRVAIGNPGLLHTLRFEEDTMATQPLSDDYVEISAKAIGINFKDCLLLLGQLNENALGLECAGVVRRAGINSGFSKGDRVCMLGKDTIRSTVHVDARHVIRIPDSLSFANAAAMPMNFVTAWYALHWIAKLEEGESILIHAGAGGVGQMAIQIAQYKGANIFATVGSAEKKKLITELYGIPENHIFSSRDKSFAEDVSCATQGRGVDVLLNCLSGNLLTSSWECIAAYGRFVEIGKMDISANENLPMAPFEKNVAFAAIDIAAAAQDRPERIRSCMGTMLEWINAGRLTPAAPVHTLGIQECEKAFRMLQSGSIAGKVVLEVRDDSNVPARINPKPAYLFPEHQTFVIAGAFGGLGRTVVRWFASRGARNLVLLSRSGPVSQAATNLCRDLEQRGIRFEAPACDISNLESLEGCLRRCSRSLPPITGCVNTAMVRKDTTFETMSHEDWTTSVNPKVHGSWNLHQLLPHDISFFILLASVNGLTGFACQANYAAGNTAQDQLAHHRISQGKKAVSIDLGIMVDEGFMSEEPELLKAFMERGCYNPVTRPQFHQLLDHYCNPALPLLSQTECQVAIGLQVPANHDIEESTSWLKMPLFAGLSRAPTSLQTQDTNDTTASSSSSSSPYSETIHLTHFHHATSTASAARAAEKALALRLARSLSKTEEEIDVAQPLHLFGVDSLSAIELRNWIKMGFGAEVTTLEILDGRNVLELAGVVAEKVKVKVKVEWGGGEVANGDGGGEGGMGNGDGEEGGRMTNGDEGEEE